MSRIRYIFEYDDNIFSSNGDILFCKLCEVKITCKKQFTVLHLKTDKHIHAIERHSGQQ